MITGEQSASLDGPLAHRPLPAGIDASRPHGVDASATLPHQHVIRASPGDLPGLAAQIAHILVYDKQHPCDTIHGQVVMVSVAGNVGHIVSLPGAPVTVADRVTAVVSPVAAFAGLMIGLLVVKMSAQRTIDVPVEVIARDDHAELLADAARIVEDAQADGRPVSRRELAAQLRERGHRFSNQMLRDIAGAAASSAAADDLAA